jgi:hypothetical protein
MDKDIGLTGNQYNIASTIFFVPYILFGEQVDIKFITLGTDRVQRFHPTSSSRRLDLVGGLQLWCYVGEW